MAGTDWVSARPTPSMGPAPAVGPGFCKRFDEYGSKRSEVPRCRSGCSTLAMRLARIRRTLGRVWESESRDVLH